MKVRVKKKENLESFMKRFRKQVEKNNIVNILKEKMKGHINKSNKRRIEKIKKIKKIQKYIRFKNKLKKLY